MTRLLRAIILVALVAASSSYAQSNSAWLRMLRKGAFAELEAQTTALQKRFEAGQETEFALREAYRPFYDLNEQDWKSLVEGDQNKAIRYFHKALELGAKAGGEVPQELKYSWYYRCKFPELAAYCR